MDPGIKAENVSKEINNQMSQSCYLHHISCVKYKQVVNIQLI